MQDGGKPRIHILSGCTAVGKTELALSWAEAMGAEIISCDSLLFYRGMNIGTAKPSTKELARIPHHLIDVCEVSEQMDITRYVTLARQALAAILAAGRSVLVTGGSGFYLKSFFQPVADEVHVPEEIRHWVRGLELPLMLDELLRLNPAGLGKLDTENPRRVCRALERCRASGRTLLELAEAFAQLPLPYADHEISLTILERDPVQLDERIRLRVRQMMQAGLIDEVRGLGTEGFAKNPSAASAIGYREVLAHLANAIPLDELEEQIIRNTRALVRKQRTWFRGQLPVARMVNAESASVSSLFII